jgi:flagellar hook-basal body complex protein FliE
MSIPISAIVPVSIPQISPVSSSTAAPGGFQSVLEGLVGGVEKSQAQAQQTVNSFLTGGNE